MGKDMFFEQENCDRCGQKLVARTMSWFTDETICIECSQAEDLIKQKLREQGKKAGDYEGCGYIPKV